MRFIIEVEVADPKLFEVYTSGFARGPLIDRMRRMVNTGHILYMPEINGLRLVDVREMPDEPAEP